jgi:hypothetical protein
VDGGGKGKRTECQGLPGDRQDGAMVCDTSLCRPLTHHTGALT